jgi:hypothetical protein
VRIAVDVTLGNLPVVGARIARLARVAEHDAAFELAWVHVEGHARRLAGLQLDGGYAAVHGRTVILEARRHLDHLRFDVLRDVEQRLRIMLGAGVFRECAAYRDVHGRRPGNAGPGRRLAARGQANPVRAESMRQLRQQRQRGVGSQLIERQIFLFIGVFRHQLDAVVRPCFDPCARAQRDSGIQGLRAGVKEIERPDVDGSSGQINSGGR